MGHSEDLGEEGTVPLHGKGGVIGNIQGTLEELSEFDGGILGAGVRSGPGAHAQV